VKKYKKALLLTAGFLFGLPLLLVCLWFYMLYVTPIYVTSNKAGATSFAIVAEHLGNLQLYLLDEEHIDDDKQVPTAVTWHGEISGEDGEYFDEAYWTKDEKLFVLRAEMDLVGAVEFVYDVDRHDFIDPCRGDGAGTTQAESGECIEKLVVKHVGRGREVLPNGFRAEARTAWPWETWPLVQAKEAKEASYR
jgi:hypothetical protein